MGKIITPSLPYGKVPSYWKNFKNWCTVRVLLIYEKLGQTFRAKAQLSPVTRSGKNIIVKEEH